MVKVPGVQESECRCWRHWSPDCPRLARALAGLRARGLIRAHRGLAGPRFAGLRVFRSAFYRVYLNGKVITLDRSLWAYITWGNVGITLVINWDHFGPTSQRMGHRGSRWAQIGITLGINNNTFRVWHLGDRGRDTGTVGDKGQSHITIHYTTFRA